MVARKNLLNLFIFLLALCSFLTGYFWTTKRPQNPSLLSAIRPKIDFTLSSLCPINPATMALLHQVYNTFVSQVDFQPHYLFQKIDNLTSYCGPDQACKNENIYLKKSDNTYYTAPHGRQEINENIRELCAWKLSENKQRWWTFIENVQNNCLPQNIDDCWDDQAKSAGLDSNLITACFNQEAFTLIDQELSYRQSNNITSSPLIFINNTLYKPNNLSADNLKNDICRELQNRPASCLHKLSVDQIPSNTGNCSVVQ